MSKRQHVRNSKEHHATPDAEVAPWAVDQESRQRSMAAHARETRTRMSVGQSHAMRLKRGNQPRHGA